MYFIEVKILYFDYNFTELHPNGPICNKFSLVIVRQQAIIWTNDGLVY